jgi:hypothetical protein
LAAAAALVALAFALSTLERWLDRRKPHELAWTLALAMFTLGAGALWLGAADGWNGFTFRIFYLFGAILNVPFLALGTIYLLGGRRRGDRWAVVIALAGAFAAGVIAVAPLRARIPAHRLPQGSEVFGPLPRVLAAVASGAGALVVLGGAAWSAWRLWRRAGPGHLALANAVIAFGTLVLGASGLLNSVLGQMEGFAVTLTVGITLLFVGFLVTNTGRPKATPAAPPGDSSESRTTPAGRATGS